MWWLINACSSAIFLFSIVLSIPIAFDVGGRDAGLAYSLSLFLFYIFYSTSKLITPEKSRIRWFFKSLVGLSQWIVIPALLIWALNRFSVDADSANWVSRTFAHVTGQHKSWREWFWGSEGFVENVALGSWDNTLSYSSPVFQLLEGFCSLLVIQAAGQIARWLVNRGRSDTWVARIFLTPTLFCAHADINPSDHAPDNIRCHQLHGHLLLMACHVLPTNRQLRCHAHRRCHDLSLLPLRFWHCQRPRESDRVFPSFCVHGSLCLSDFHRLSALARGCRRGGSCRCCAAGFSASAAHPHGLLHHSDPHAQQPSVGFWFIIPVSLRGIPNHHP